VALVALLGVGTVALVANRVIAREFTLYISRGGQMRSQEWAQLAAEYYQRTGSWEGLSAFFGEAALGRGLGQGRGRRYGQQGQGTGGASTERILIVSPEGQIVFDTQGELVGRPVAAENLELGAEIVVDGQTVGTLLATTRDLSGHSEFERRFLETVNRAVVWAVLLVAAAALLAAVLLSQQLVAPLRQLTAAAEAMASGDLSQRVDVRAGDEIGDLALAFNRMAGDLQDAETQRRQMTADIAHELRNPLSVIRGNLEAIFDGVYSADIEHLTPIYEETLLLQRLVEDLRLLSLVDAGQLELVRSDVDVERLLVGVAEGAQAVAQDKGITLQVETPEEPLVIDGDADRLRQVVGNLVSNALRYTPAGGLVTLHAHRADHSVHFAVTDTGPGIPAKDLPHVFDRFYRGDAARDRASGGSGLGLAIARALVEAHGGTIEVESTVRQGTTFLVELPPGITPSPHRRSGATPSRDAPPPGHS
jgi:two-component system OmpR family sensor kinase/two-component system sensor histidine kinase BaeS